MPIDKEDLLKARNKLRICVIGYWLCLIGMTPVVLTWYPLVEGVEGSAELPKNPFILAILFLYIVTCMCAFIFFAVSTIFRVKFVLNKMNKMAWLWQLGLIFIPYGFGFVVIPLLVMYEADKFLKSKNIEEAD